MAAKASLQSAICNQPLTHGLQHCPIGSGGRETMVKSSKGWTVDQLAAQLLCTELKLDASDEMRDRIAQHFSEHRKNMLQWAAQRIRHNMARALEKAFSGNARNHEDGWHDDGWMRGYRRAEELLLTMSNQELLALEPEQSRSKGQILRTMMRQARQR
jgi:hypothetical protein